jgi:protein-tyrosine-phosphatase
MKRFLILLGLAFCAAPAANAHPFQLMFVDTGDTGRAVAAEYLADNLIVRGQLPIRTISRGVDVNPFAIKPEANVLQLLAERNIDASSYRAVQVSEDDMRHADLVLTMTAAQKTKLDSEFPSDTAKIMTISEYAAGSNTDVVDAYGKPLADYQTMVGQVSGYLPAVLKKVLQPK